MSTRAKRGLVTRYALLPALAVALLTAVLLIVGQRLVVDSLTQTALRRSLHRAATLALQLDDALRASVREVRLLARNPLLTQTGSTAQLRRELDFAKQQLPSCVWIGFVMPDGTVLAGTKGWLEGRSIATRPVFQHGLGGTWVGDVHAAVALAQLLHESGEKPQELIDIGEPVHDADGRLVGVLAVHLGVDWIDRLRNVATGEFQSSVVPELTTYVLSGSSGRSVLPTSPIPSGIPLRIDGPQELAAADGTRFFGISREVANDRGEAVLPWRVLLLQPREAALRQGFRSLKQMWLIGTLATIVFGVLGFVMAQRLLRPWHPVFDQVMSKLEELSGSRSIAEGVDTVVRGLAAAPTPAPTGPEALLMRLARDAHDLKRVIDHLPVGVALIDREFRVEYLNPSHTRLLGWTTEQVRGRMAAEYLFDAVERAEFVRQYGLLGEQPGELAARFDAVTPGGARVAIQWHLVPMFDEAGHLAGSIAVIHDIRPERAARARADALAGRLRALADAAVDELIATLDLDGRVVEWSRGAELLSGQLASDALGRGLGELMGCEGTLASWLLDARRDGSRPIADDLATADGRRRWFEGSLYALGLAPGAARFGLILRDLTEQREVHRALERSEARLRLAIEAARMGTWETDLTGPRPMATWSSSYSELLGLASVDGPRRADDMHTLVDPADWPRVRDAMVQTQKTDAPLAVEFRLMRPDGPRWHALYGRSQRGPDGRALRIIGVGMDIDERKQAEQALREGRERLERVLQTMAEGVVILDADGVFTMVNSAAARNTGAPAERLIGRRFDDVPFRRMRPGGGAFSEVGSEDFSFVRLQRGEGEIRNEIAMVERADGGHRVFSHNAQPLRDEQGRFLGAVLTYSDITERYLAEQALADSQGRLAAIVDSASDAIVSTDVEGRISLLNPAAERIFGVDAAALVGQPLDQLLPEAERARHGAQLQSFAGSGVSRRAMGAGHVQGRHASGRLLELEASISHALVHGQSVLTAILRDVTDRASQQRALELTRVQLAQLTQRLLAQEKETTRRLAQALHDEVGQTLTALRLHWEAQQNAEPALAARLNERVGALVVSANRQIRHVLGELRPPLLDEFGLVAALDNELQQQRPVQGPPTLALHVPARLQQQRWPADIEYAAFMIGREAVANALHHARAQRIDLKVDGDDGQLLLAVQDDGMGLADDAHAGRPGHLGLVGMRERALAIGATFTLASEPGHGTIITLQWNPADEPDLPGR